MYSTEFHVLALTAARRHKLAVHVQLGLGHPAAEHNHAAYQHEEGQEGQTHDESGRGDIAAPADLLGVEKIVGIEALRGDGDKRETEIAQEDDEEPEQVDPGRWLDAGEEELKEGKDAVEGVPGNSMPCGKVVGEQAAAAAAVVDDGPEDDGDEKGQCDDRCLEERMEGLEGAREAGEEGGVATTAGGDDVRKGVDGGDGEVAGDAPEGEDGEVRKGAAGGGAATEVAMDAGPGKLEEEGCKGVHGLERESKGNILVSKSLQYK